MQEVIDELKKLLLKLIAKTPLSPDEANTVLMLSQAVLNIVQAKDLEEQ